MTSPSPGSENEECKNMSSDYPSFCKTLRISNISGEFGMYIPKKFCVSHMPSHNSTIILVGENAREYRVKYYLQLYSLRTGWKGFAVDHNLVEGDTAAFHLIEPCKFKVYITRAKKLSKKDSQVNKPVGVGRYITRASKSSEIDSQEDEHVVKKKAKLITETNHAKDPSANDSYFLGSNVPEGIQGSESVISFEEVKGLGDFRIQVDGLILDSEIPSHLRKKYYELCCSQEMFLHHHLIEGVDRKVAVVVISETTEIADAIRAADIATFLHRFESWQKTLQEFEDLGMEVGFLCTRLHKLVRLSQLFEDASEYRRKCALFDEKRRALQENNLKVDALLERSVAFKASMESLATEVDTFRKKNEKLGIVFKEIAGCPWQLFT